MAKNSKLEVFSEIMNNIVYSLYAKEIFEEQDYDLEMSTEALRSFSRTLKMIILTKQISGTSDEDQKSSYIKDTNEIINEIESKVQEMLVLMEKKDQELKKERITNSEGYYSDLIYDTIPIKNKKQKNLVDSFLSTAKFIEENCKDSPERTMSVRRLQESLMWANNSNKNGAKK